LDDVEGRRRGEGGGDSLGQVDPEVDDVLVKVGPRCGGSGCLEVDEATCGGAEVNSIEAEEGEGDFAARRVEEGGGVPREHMRSIGCKKKNPLRFTSRGFKRRR
jgi:hypothetical protein